MENLIIFAIIGFFAQLIDGALGMAYGVSSNSFLLSMGVPPAVASANVHFAEVFVTMVSGIFHFKFGNVNKELFKKLVLPGVLGGIVGACILTSMPSAIIKPLVSIYLLIVGILIVSKVFKKIQLENVGGKGVRPLALLGGFSDAIGGGGWGPIVTSTLVAQNHNPRYVIGSVNAAEFFVTFAEVITFIFLFTSIKLDVILGLLIGGILAAPLASYTCKRIPQRLLMVFVGLLIIFLSLRNLYLEFI